MADDSVLLLELVGFAGYQDAGVGYRTLETALHMLAQLDDGLMRQPYLPHRLVTFGLPDADWLSVSSWRFIGLPSDAHLADVRICSNARVLSRCLMDTSQLIYAVHIAASILALRDGRRLLLLAKPDPLGFAYLSLLASEMSDSE